MKTNDLKLGDEIIIRKFGFARTNGTTIRLNKVMIVNSTQQNSSSNGPYVQINPKDDPATMLYLYDKDDFDLATKNAQIRHYTNKIAGLEKAILEAKIELEFHEKYDSMEEYVADKLIAIMKTDDKKALVTMLKTLKQTNFL